MSEFVTIFEVAPRDGLQNVKKVIPTAEKIQFVNLLSKCGFKKIEVGSFVNPSWIPHMADSREVMDGIIRHPEVKYCALTPNLNGLEQAISAKADEIAIFSSASESFSQKNTNCSIEESIERYKQVVKKASENGIPVRGYLSCAVDCHYEGSIAPAKVAEVAKRLMDLGVYELSLGDTTGQGTPETVLKMLNAVLNEIPANMLAGHFHDTNERAVENIEVGLERGIRVFDSSIGGLGGCPYMPGAKGNVDTKDVVSILDKNGYSSGLDLENLNSVAKFAKKLGEKYD